MNKGHKDLRVWQQAMTLAETVYQATKTFPSDERFGLTSQMRRAAVSVPSNIAEGRGRGTDAEFIRFCRIAYGSLMELETQAELAHRLGFLPNGSLAPIMNSCIEVGRMLNALRSSLVAGHRSSVVSPRLPDRQPITDDRQPTTDDRQP
ncbi:four helix bundle protein [uncultured Thiodictyon sp.]|jgi:four helix bundle protein|uniref:four helix bundle protein n=1 Tax=uncultured Thiodictyon sp. TaxID=1846217 RepID=UPI0025D527C0|nr:four helix bundle protein [uncultured Thiodictyon sp.]